MIKILLIILSLLIAQISFSREKQSEPLATSNLFLMHIAPFNSADDIKSNYFYSTMEECVYESNPKKRKRTIFFFGDESKKIILQGFYTDEREQHEYDLQLTKYSIEKGVGKDIVYAERKSQKNSIIKSKFEFFENYYQITESEKDGEVIVKNGELLKEDARKIYKRSQNPRFFICDHPKTKEMTQAELSYIESQALLFNETQNPKQSQSTKTPLTKIEQKIAILQELPLQFYSFTETFNLFKAQYDYNVRYGAPPVSANHIKMIKQEIPELYKALGQCSKKLGGSDINESTIEKNFQTNNSEAVSGARTMLAMAKMIGPTVKAPTTQKHLNAAPQHEQSVRLALNNVYSLLKIKSEKDWCQWYKNAE